MWEGHKIWKNIPLVFDITYETTRNFFFKFLLPSQNIWTLEMFTFRGWFFLILGVSRQFVFRVRDACIMQCGTRRERVVRPSQPFNFMLYYTFLTIQTNCLETPTPYWIPFKLMGWNHFWRSMKSLLDQCLNISKLSR